MADAIGSSLTTIISAFDGRVIALRELIAFRALGDSNSCRALEECDAAVSALEAEIATTRGIIVREAALLAEAAELQRRSARVAGTLGALQTRLPAALPGDTDAAAADSDKQQDRPPLANLGDAVTASRSLIAARSRRTPPPLALVTESELLSAPSYMRSRESQRDLARANAALQELQALLQSKYLLLSHPASAVRTLSEADRKRHASYKALETETTRGVFFFTEEDLKAVKVIGADASGKNTLTLLRHLGRLKEFKHNVGLRCWKATS